MRTTLFNLLCLPLLFVSISAFSQYPEFQNADFEEWEMGIWNLNPVGWEVMNSQLFENTVPDSSAYEGEVAMRVRPFNFFEATPGLASQEVACGSIPPGLNFAVKCNIDEQDSVKVMLIFTNNGMPVYTAQWATGETIEDWEVHSITLDQIEPVITHCRIFVQAGYGEIFLEGSPNTWISIDAISVGEPVGVQDESLPTIQVYPNPTFETIRIQGISIGDRYEVYDLLGQRVLEGRYRGSISVAHLAEGQYFLRVSSGAGVLRESFFKR